MPYIQKLLSFFLLQRVLIRASKSVELFHSPSCLAFLFPTRQRSIEVIKFRATQSPRLISHVRRSGVFQLLPIGSRYYTGARRPPGGRLSLNRLRNDVKSLQRRRSDARTQRNGRKEKKNREGARRMK